MHCKFFIMLFKRYKVSYCKYHLTSVFIITSDHCCLRQVAILLEGCTQTHICIMNIIVCILVLFLLIRLTNNDGFLWYFLTILLKLIFSFLLCRYIRPQFFYNNPLLSFIQFVIGPYTDDLGNVLPYAVEGVGVPVDPLAFAGLLGKSQKLVQLLGSHDSNWKHWSFYIM